MIRVVIVLHPDYATSADQVVTREFDEAQPGGHEEALALQRQAACSLDVSSISWQKLPAWFDATWAQLLSGDEVLGDDGNTWVVSRGLSQASPHEVEIYRFGRPDVRFAFTPQYDAPVKARRMHESQMQALLMTELGARVIE